MFFWGELVVAWLPLRHVFRYTQFLWRDVYMNDCVTVQLRHWTIASLNNCVTVAWLCHCRFFAICGVWMKDEIDFSLRLKIRIKDHNSVFWVIPSCFLDADTRLYTLPCRVLHYGPCPTVRDCLAVYPALYLTLFPLVSFLFLFFRLFVFFVCFFVISFVLFSLLLLCLYWPYSNPGLVSFYWGNAQLMNEQKTWKKQGQIHGKTVADSWAGAVMRKPLAI